LGVRGLNQKSKKKFCRVPHGELTGKKWFDFDSIEKQKRRSDLKEHRDIHTDIHYRQTEATTKNNRLLD